MAVLRIVPNLAADRPEDSRAFWQDTIGVEAAMDTGRIVPFGGPGAPQVSVMSEGGSGIDVPAVSVEVDDDVDATLETVRSAGHEIVYGPADEPWGVRRFFVRAPSGHVVNVLGHAR